MEFHDEFVLDFAKRTETNLKLVEAAKSDGKEAFEFTQLINSLLGLIIFPYEHTGCTIQDASLSDLVSNKGWPLIVPTKGKLKANTLGELIRVIRHSFAHCLVELLPDGNRQVHRIRLWNGNENAPSWETIVTVSEFRSFVLKFAAMIQDQQNVSGV